MSDAMANYLRAQAMAGTAKPWQRAYLLTYDNVTGANEVQVTGTQTIVNATILGPLDALVVGPVMLAQTDGGPVILGILTKPPV